MAFPLPMQITERLLVKEAPFSEQQMEELTGLTRRVGQRVFFGAFPSRTQTTEQPLVTVEPSSEQQMGDTRGLARQAERTTRSSGFPLPMRMPARQLVFLAQSLQPMEASAGL